MRMRSRRARVDASVARPRWRPRLGALETAVVVIGLVVVAVVGGVLTHAVSTFSGSVPLAGVTQDIQLHLTLSHLWLEESVGGDTSVAVGPEVYANVDEAQRLCQAMMTGGPSRFGQIEPMRGADQMDVMSICDGITDFRELATARLSSPASHGIGTANDKAYDMAFRQLLDQTDRDIQSMRRTFDAEEASLRRLEAGLVVLLIVLFAAIALMVSSYRRALESKNSALSELGAIIHSTDDAILSKTPTGVVTSWNLAAERLYGYTAAEIVGKPVEVLVPEHRRAQELEILAQVGAGTQLRNYETDRVRKDGVQIPVALTVSPIYQDGVVTGISAISHDITEQKQAEEALAGARDQALEGAREKSEFLATMSHEIRTPMNGVIGLTGLLLDTSLSEVQRRYASGVRGAGESLLRIIDDILDFSKLEAGKVELEQVDFSPRELVEEVGVLLASTASAKGLELIAHCNPDVPVTLHGDPGRLRQILLNLGSNAVKFTASGEVVLRASVAGIDGGQVQVRFEVSDTGIGIDPAAQSRLFQPFSQADASTTRRYGGTGLGLAICQRLVDAMRGQIALDSVPGGGSTFAFTVSLPISPPVAAHGALANLLAGVHVLVVDDNATNRLVLSGELAGWGLRPDPTSDGSSALEMLRAAVQRGDPYHIALLDMCMPDMDGLELAAAIADDPAFGATRTMLLTSAGPMDPERVERAAVREWASKPVRSSELYDALMRLSAAEGMTVARAELGRSAAAQQPTGSRGRVLVVEDNEVNQLVAEGVLVNLGFTVELVADGRQALAALEARDYDLVLMDCHMPGMDGYQATAELRRREAERPGPGRVRTPVVAMTAGVLAGEQERCLAAGMDDFVPKPVDVGVLERCLARWIPAASPVPAAPTGARGLPSAPEREAVNEPRLRLLRAMGPDDGWGLLPALVEAFVQAVPGQRDSIRGAVDSADMPALHQAAHLLRGAAANLGATALAEVCGELETLELAGGEPGSPHALVVPLEYELERAGTALIGALPQPA